MSESSSDEYHRQHRKRRHRSRSYSPQDERRNKRHKRHRRHHSDDSENDDRRPQRHERDRRDQREYRHERDHREEKYDPHKKIKKEPDDNLRQQKSDRERNDEKRRRARHQRENENSDNFQFGEGNRTGPGPVKKEKEKEKEKPNFEVSGKLTEDTNTYKGVVVKYNEPPEARKPRKKWRLYPFKGDQALPLLHLHRQSAFLMGRDRRVADIPVDHPSCSKQHAALQFRMVDCQRGDGVMGRMVKPYVIDLGSANGTFVNNKQIEPQRYVELLEKDVLKFGFSSREYVLLHEKADTSELHDDSEEESSS